MPDDPANHTRPQAIGIGVRPIIIDTDLNFPSDDLQALLLLIGEYRSKGPLAIKGISACGGNTFAEEVIVNIAALLALLELYDVPLAKGEAYTSHSARRNNALESLRRGCISFAGSHAKSAQPRFSVHAPCYSDLCSQFIIFSSLEELIFAQSSKVDVLCLGPLTNLARAIRRSPPVKDLIGAVWFMGSTQHLDEANPKLEFNVWYDPEAANEVLRSSLSVNVLPYELSRRCSITEELIATIEQFTDGIPGLFRRDFLGMVQQHGRTMPLCDQLLAACYLRQSIISAHAVGRIDIGLTPNDLYGSSCFVEGEPGNVRLILDVEFEELSTVLPSLISNLDRINRGTSIERLVQSPIYSIDADHDHFDATEHSTRR